jgi:hypothetical protein
VQANFRVAVVVLLAFVFSDSVWARRVTLITHGMDSNASGWVLQMAFSIQEYHAKQGTTSDVYLVTYPRQPSPPMLPQFFVQQMTTNSANPDKDIVIAFDWSYYATSSLFGLSPDYPNTAVGPNLSEWLEQTNRLPDIDRPLTQSYLHLIGHSRGGSLVCGLAGILSSKGTLVSQVTTLDPRPYGPALSPDYPAEVAPSVIFADNYYQNYDFLTYGLFVTNAFNRTPFLADNLVDTLAGPQPTVSDGHTNIREWYQRTIEEWDLSQFPDWQQQLYREWFNTNDAGGTTTGYFFSA